MERHLGRKLKLSELVHHKDGNVFNNKINNLMICSRSKHRQIHAREVYRNYYNLEWLKEQLALGIKQKDIARECNVSPQAINKFIIKYLRERE